jgi:hypothetical protein
LVVVTMGLLVLVSAERLTVIVGLVVSSTSSHLSAASSPCRMQVLSATTIGASSRVPSAAATRHDASSREREHIGRVPLVAAFFTLEAGFEAMRPSCTAWFSAPERTPCMRPTVFGLRASSSLRALKARTRAEESSRSRTRSKNGMRWLSQVRW